MPYDVVVVGPDAIVRASYETGGEAGQVAACLNAAERESGSETRYRVIQRKEETPETPAWHKREIERFNTGDYTIPPWLYEPWWVGDQGELGAYERLVAGKHNHFAHVAKGDPAKIAYTPDNACGDRDVQRRMRVGRYLQQYYGDVLTNERIQELCAQWDTEYGVGLEVKFASSSEEIVEVYQNGPNSCMSHHTGDYSSEDVHPTHAYGAGDLAVAYLKNEDRITARAICWPEKKVYGRVYGDTHRLHELMSHMGWDHEEHNDPPEDSAFNGARLLKIPVRRGWVMPWLDHVGTVRDGGKFFIIDCDGDIDAQDTDGVTHGARGARCDHCDEYYDADNEGNVVDDRSLCEACYEQICFYCEDCEESHIGEGSYCDHTNRTLCQGCFDRTHSDCEECDRTCHHDDLEADVNGREYCETCREDIPRNEHGELDPDYQPEDDADTYQPTPTIHDPRQEELAL